MKYMHAAAACSILLALHVQTGSHVIEHTAYDDRIAWVLPADRLAAFARGGVVINEDKKTQIIAAATASTSPHGMITLNGTLNKITEDVPRHRAEHSYIDVSDTLTPRNAPLPARTLDIEEAAMTDLPEQRLCVGQTWRTRIPVVTSLGSGIATFDHKVTISNGRLIQIAVSGAGVISGLEYNLPRLLPGFIQVNGKAWFDTQGGLFTQESYMVHNKLIRTVKGKTIGFLETESVEVTTRLNATGRTSRPDPRKKP